MAGAMDAVAAESDEVKTAVAGATAAAAAAAVGPPVGKTVGVLWTILVGGLVAAVLGALVGIIWTVLDDKDGTSPDVIVTVFSSALAALIGLFVKSPTSS